MLEVVQTERPLVKTEAATKVTTRKAQEVVGLPEQMATSREPY